MTIRWPHGEHLVTTWWPLHSYVRAHGISWPSEFCTAARRLVIGKNQPKPKVDQGKKEVHRHLNFILQLNILRALKICKSLQWRLSFRIVCSTFSLCSLLFFCSNSEAFMADNKVCNNEASVSETCSPLPCFQETVHPPSSIHDRMSLQNTEKPFAFHHLFMIGCSCELDWRGSKGLISMTNLNPDPGDNWLLVL